MEYTYILKREKVSNLDICNNPCALFTYMQNVQRANQSAVS